MTQVADSTHHNIMVQKIKKRMDEMGINARQLAAKAQVGKSFVYDILNGKSKNPTSSKLNSISRELGISISYLINNASNSINYDHYVPIYSLEDAQNANVLLSKSFCAERLSNSKNDLYTHRMYDDSMSPTIQNNEFVVIKRCQSSDEIQSGIYLIKDKFGGIIRRLERIIGTDMVKIVPDNAKYSTYNKNLDEINVVGKVVLSFKEM
jgi:transcriptional regulator with XRE-family HTH domain